MAEHDEKDPREEIIDVGTGLEPAEETWEQRRYRESQEGRANTREKRLEKYGDWEENPPEHLVAAEKEKKEAERKVFEADIDVKQTVERARRSQYVIKNPKKGAAPLSKLREWIPVWVAVAVLGFLAAALREPWYVILAVVVASGAGAIAAQYQKGRQRQLEAVISELWTLNDYFKADANVHFERNLALKKELSVFHQLHDFEENMNVGGAEVLLGGSSMMGGRTTAKLRLPLITLHQHLVSAMVEGYKHNTRRGGEKLHLVGDVEMQRIRPIFEEIAWKWLKEMSSGKR